MSSTNSLSATGWPRSRTMPLPMNNTDPPPTSPLLLEASGYKRGREDEMVETHQETRMLCSVLANHLKRNERQLRTVNCGTKEGR